VPLEELKLQNKERDLNATADDEGVTPHELIPRASVERTFLANLALKIGELGSAIAEVSRSWDSATPDQQRAFAVRIAERLGDGGDAMHEARREVRAFEDP